MAIIKPDVIFWSQQVRHYQDRFLNVITGGIAFKLSAPQVLLNEAEFKHLWSEITEQPLDEHYPKTLSEVLVVGESIGAHEVNLKIGSIDKTLKIFPARFWYPAPKFNQFLPYEPAPELKNVQLVWENAYGGQGYALNPQGKGFVASRAELYDEGERVPLPLIENPRHLLQEAFLDHDIEPINLAPLPMLHPLRWRYAEASGYLELMPKIPEAINPLFFQQASLDQTQKEAFLPKAPFSISGMSAQGIIQSYLPAMMMRMFVQTKVQPFKEINTRADTLWLLPNQDVGVLIFRGIDEVGDWNANEHQNLMLVLEDSERVQSLAFFRDIFDKMLGEQSHLYRSGQQGLLPETELTKAMVVAEKAGHLRKQMQQSIGQAPSQVSAKIMPTSSIKKMLTSFKPICGQRWAQYDFSNFDFSHKVLEEINFSGADLRGADFTGAKLNKVNFIGANLSGVQFRQAQLTQVLFANNIFEAVNFSFAQVNESSFNQCVFKHATWRHASFKDCQFFKTISQQTDALHVLMRGCLLSAGQWSQINMAYAELQNVRVNNQLFSEVNFANSKSERSGFMGSKTRFVQCQWQHGSWRDTNFLEAQFEQCFMSHCSFPASEWMATSLQQVCFFKTDLAHNAFNDAELKESSFEQCQLAHSTWQGAHLQAVDFKDNFEYGMNLHMARLEIKN